MRIVVCMKQVYDPATTRISRSREEFDLRGAVKITNTPDKHALEAALRLRAAVGGEVIALSLGDAEADDVCREAIAMGADRALLISGPEVIGVTGRAVARALTAGVRYLDAVDLVLTGQVGLTDGTGSLAPRLAAELGWEVCLDAVRLAPMTDGQIEVTVACSPGVGEIVCLALPAVISVATGSERPRYAHPARIANAWAPGLVEVCSCTRLGLDAAALTADVEVGGLILPPERTRGQTIVGPTETAADELVGLLRTKRIL